MLSDGTFRGIKPQASTCKIADQDGISLLMARGAPAAAPGPKRGCSRIATTPAAFQSGAIQPKCHVIYSR
jgi:hypothetical protein